MSQAVMKTSEGAITFELFDDDAPKTVQNFKDLAAKGFYDGLTFHRIIKDFMIQGGCPQGTGTGGPGYTFEDEFNDHKVVRGALAMANAGPDTNGSQFFIVTADACPWLDGKHTVFGEVVDGMDAVVALEALPVDGRDAPREPAGLAEADIIHAIAAGAGLDGEAIRNVRMLERFALLEVPAKDAVRVADAVDGTDVRGHTLRLEPARS